MKFKKANGIIVTKNLTKYRIDWDAKSLSKYQYKLKQFLRKYLINHVVYEEAPVVGSRMTLDFLDITTRIAYEMQGEQHLGFSKFFHNNSQSNYLSQLKRDGAKQIFCDENGILLIEIYPEDLDKLSYNLFQDKFGVSL